MTEKTRSIRLFPLALVLIVLAAPALAHNLILEAYPVNGGKAVEGDVFFSDGTLVKGGTVVVTDDAGKVLQELTTDDKGNFAYTPAAAVTQHLKLDAGAGHVASVTIAAGKLAGGSSAAAVPAPPIAGPTLAPSATAGPAGGVDAAGLQRIAQMVSTEIVPLQTEVETYKSHNDQMNLLAAIGLLCGFAGVLLFSAGAALVKSGPTTSGSDAARNRVRS